MPRIDTRTRNSPGELAAREISYRPDDATDWSGDGPVDVAEALDELTTGGGLWEVSGGNTQLKTDDDILISPGAALKIIFRDSAIFIHSNADGELTIQADTKVTIGVAGDIVLGDGTLRDMYPQTDEKIDLGKAANKFNAAFFAGIVDANDAGVRGKTVTQAVVASPPTDANLDAAFGTPAAVGAGFSGFLHDTTDNQYWLCITDGTDWFYEELTKAV